MEENQTDRQKGDNGGEIRLPEAPVLVVYGSHVTWLTSDGEIVEESVNEAIPKIGDVPPLVIHRLATARKMGLNPFTAFDILELFAFTCPAKSCLPTARGIAQALGLDEPDSLEDQAFRLYEVVNLLLDRLTRLPADHRKAASRIAMTMGQAGWNWAPYVLAALGVAEGKGPYGGLDIWKDLPEWPDFAPDPPPDDEPVSDQEARVRLQEILHEGAEARPQQADFSAAASHAFTPREQEDCPRLVLAEAGTGTGKTLGYIAPASVWAEKNGTAVWISTYTKNLQRQIDEELDRLYPDPAIKRQKAVVRKGRENYVCLLNYEEALQGGAAMAGDRIILGMIARWLSATRDGDMGGDLPGWLFELAGHGRINRLADRRGECIYSACSHYKKCFIEKSTRKARKADIVIANHALVMINAASRPDDPNLPKRHVFDEGHHLFDAADSAFSVHLTGLEGAELRRWISGSDTARKGRMRGLEKRISDLLGDNEEGQAHLQDAINASFCLPKDGWMKRLEDGLPNGPMETFLHLIKGQVRARSGAPDSPYSIECAATEFVDGVEEAALKLEKALADLATPLMKLAKTLVKRLDEDAEELDTATRQRIEAAVQGLSRRTATMISPWIDILKNLNEPTPDAFVDWLGLERVGGRDFDLGYYRSWVDPTKPFSEVMLKPSHGVLIASATLRDQIEEDDDWTSADMRTGASHLVLPPKRTHLTSPFDFKNRTRVIVVTDVRRDHMKEVSSAYRELFLAAGGGGIGLFTAIWRLREVHKNIADSMSENGIDLYAQHMDAMDTATLVDIFREEENSVLLGTDAVRDGVDVPGRSLRLMVFDRVPWPRPDLKHKARKAAFGGSRYDDMLTRLKLKQAYGRLLRRDTDYGVFVMLDSMMPSRLATAFPPGVEIERVGLKDAISLTRNFLAEKEQEEAKISLDIKS
ncbi:ATP-dependent DNA helicase [Sneathiella sp. P13V-1]|uniref:ATP-dependent DNA helicase n=1 Tax=Sneathiella sp. P13V-1 TaxID=2697366 RepID=UPI00187B9E57|nr:ATP-dependent DNA helicase [Sneathiella sp. P13V-1]MBE7636465.1 ATP-dependent DNA helicase [Sneathiella sp. P13V-1]